MKRGYIDLRRENHVLCPSETLEDESQLPIEPLHTVLAPPNALSVLVIDKLRSTYIAVERSKTEVNQLVCFQRRKRLVALRADVPLVVEFL